MSLVVACTGRSEGLPASDGGADASAVRDAGVLDGGGALDGGRGAGDAASPGVDARAPGEDDAAAPVEDAGSSDGGSPDAGFACGVLGALCNDSNPCPVDMRCYGFGGDGFCAPFAPECGGFVMTDCTGGRRCIRGGGGSIGYCATPDEGTCICDRARDQGVTTDGC